MAHAVDEEAGTHFLKAAWICLPATCTGFGRAPLVWLPLEIFLKVVCILNILLTDPAPTSTFTHVQAIAFVLQQEQMRTTAGSLETLNQVSTSWQLAKMLIANFTTTSSIEIGICVAAMETVTVLQEEHTRERRRW